MNLITARRIYMLRLAKGLSQTALGKLIGNTKQGVHKLESGSVRITVTNLIHLAHALDVSIDDIVPPSMKPKDEPFTRRVIDLALALAPLEDELVAIALEKAIEEYEKI